MISPRSTETTGDNRSSYIIDLFSKKKVSFSTDRGADARELVRLQPRRWDDLISSVSRNTDSDAEEFSLSIKKTLDVAIDLIKTNFERIFKSAPQQSEYAVFGKIPILDEKIAVDDNISYSYILAAIYCEVIVPLRRDFAIAEQSAADLDASVPLYLQVHISNYITDKSNYKYETNAEMNRIKRESVSILTSLSNFEISLKDNISKLENQFQDSSSQLKEKTDNSISSQQQEFTDFLTEARAKIEAARALAHEASTLESATNIWSRKYRKHSTIFAVVSFLLFSFIALAIYFIIKNFNVIRMSIPLKNDGDIAYGFILLILVPIVAFAWILRIFTRWAVNSLTLSEDAEQRRAMIETYLRLVADPTAKMEQADRIIVLNALFRALPGSSQEDISPPTIADFLKEALSGKK